jgi:hypothetical protein
MPNVDIWKIHVLPIFCFHIVSLTDPLFHLMKHSQNMKVCSVWRQKQKRCRQLLRKSTRCPFCFSSVNILYASATGRAAFMGDDPFVNPLNTRKIWKCAAFDVGSKNHAVNYRGITVLPVISKIVEAVIRDRIQPLIHNMQNPTQRGNSPRFVLNSRVVHTPEQMWMYNFVECSFCIEKYKMSILQMKVLISYKLAIHVSFKYQH